MLIIYFIVLAFSFCADSALFFWCATAYHLFLTGYWIFFWLSTPQLFSTLLAFMYLHTALVMTYGVPPLPIFLYLIALAALCLSLKHFFITNQAHIITVVLILLLIHQAVALPFCFGTPAIASLSWLLLNATFITLFLTKTIRIVHIRQIICYTY